MIIRPVGWTNLLGTVKDVPQIPLESPDIRGRMTLVVDGAPVSLQAKPERRQQLVDLIRDAFGPTKYLLMGDIRLSIKWFQRVKRRYESDISPDLDNILKPILDALSGPDGMIVDDCQVQSIRCKWVDVRSPDEQLEVTLRYNPDHWVVKKGLRFIHVGNGLCSVYPSRMPRAVLGMLIESMQSAVEARNIMMEHRIDYRRAQLVLPRHRFFHRTRLSNFEVLEVEDLDI